MDEVIYELSKFIPYFIIFPISVLLLSIILWNLSKKSTIIKNVAYYGIFMNLTTIDILSLALVGTYYIMIVGAIFINDISILNLILFLIPIILCNLLNKKIITIIGSILNTAFLYILLYAKSVFYNYIVDVGSTWYVILILITVSCFILFYSSYILIRNIDSILKNNKYIDK